MSSDLVPWEGAASWGATLAEGPKQWDELDKASSPQTAAWGKVDTAPSAAGLRGHPPLQLPLAQGLQASDVMPQLKKKAERKIGKNGARLFCWPHASDASSLSRSLALSRSCMAGELAAGDV